MDLAERGRHQGRGWLVGTADGAAHLLPFEMTIRASGSGFTSSGAVWESAGEDIAIVMQAVSSTRTGDPHQLRVRLHLACPLPRIRGYGTSHRFALAYVLMTLLGEVVPEPSLSVVCTGDLDELGNVLPVGGADLKVRALETSPITRLIMSAHQVLDVEKPQGVMVSRVARLKDLATVEQVASA